MPWGPTERIATLALRDGDFSVIGCLSFEERCIAVPSGYGMVERRPANTLLLQMDGDPEAFPNRLAESARRIDENRRRLLTSDSRFEIVRADLLAREDALIETYGGLRPRLGDSVVLDITCLPKRYFCFLLKMLLRQREPANVIVTYVQAGRGYAKERLAEDPMLSDHLPGFPPLINDANLIAISVGYESLNLYSLLEMYGEDRRRKILLAFPPNGTSIRRQWSAVRQFTETRTGAFGRDLADLPSEVRQTMGYGKVDVDYVAAWDAEGVYRLLRRWRSDCNGLWLAPFGAKPHTLGMALFALEQSSPLFYTQPRSYNPRYSDGIGKGWAYVVKWQGIPCYARAESIL